MLTIMNVINYLLPFFAFVLLIFGMVKNYLSYVLIAIIISIIAIVMQYEAAGGELFGSYFDATHAAVYTLCFIVVIVSMIYITAKDKRLNNNKYRYPAAFLFTAIIIAAFLIVTNTWINALFLKDKLDGTDIIQVAYFDKIDYCDNQYVFYKLNKKYQAYYLCPNHYFLVARIGHLSVTPKLLIKQLINIKNIKNLPQGLSQAASSKKEEQKK